jgi:hypothetical protein
VVTYRTTTQAFVVMNEWYSSGMMMTPAKMSVRVRRKERHATTALVSSR